MRAQLFVCSDVQICIRPSWCHCHSLSLASVISRLVLPFWYRLTWVVLDKGPLNGCVCVCVVVSWHRKQNSLFIPGLGAVVAVSSDLQFTVFQQSTVVLQRCVVRLTDTPTHTLSQHYLLLTHTDTHTHTHRQTRSHSITLSLTQTQTDRPVVTALPSHSHRHRHRQTDP